MLTSLLSLVVVILIIIYAIMAYNALTDGEKVKGYTFAFMTVLILALLVGINLIF